MLNFAECAKRCKRDGYAYTDPRQNAVIQCDHSSYRGVVTTTYKISTGSSWGVTIYSGDNYEIALPRVVQIDHVRFVNKYSPARLFMRRGGVRVLRCPNSEDFGSRRISITAYNSLVVDKNGRVVKSACMHDDPGLGGGEKVYESIVFGDDSERVAGFAQELQLPNVRVGAPPTIEEIRQARARILNEQLVNAMRNAASDQPF